MDETRILDGVRRMVDRFLRVDHAMPRKRCSRCRRRKPMTAFYERTPSGSKRFPKRRTTRDGLWSHCKQCHIVANMRCERQRKLARVGKVAA